MWRFDGGRGARTLHYGVALIRPACAAAVRLSLNPFFADRNQLVMFYPAIMLTAWLGGVGPGIVATVTSAALDGYLFLEPVFTLRLPSHGDKLALAIFIATGVVISVLNDNLRRAAVREQRARADAERARADAEAADRTKDFFIAAVSHDLRTPMNGALGWADMLTKQVLDEAQQRHAIEAIQRALNRQKVLVNDLLDNAAILSGNLRVEHKPVDVVAAVRAAVEIAEPLAAPKHLKLHAEYHGAANVEGDAARLQQVVTNLLTNAIKFTPEGGEIGVCVATRNASVEIQVTDTGKGIAADALPFVFERFWQASSSTRPDIGIGLGLSIAKHLVAAHGGTIDASSPGEGQGATFRVLLPVHGMPAPKADVVHEKVSKV
jgi:signal transduction histidine kinase